MEKKKIIGIKLGSATLVNDGKIRHKFIRRACKQIAWLVKGGSAVFLVTSGAIASDSKKSRSNNLRSSVGQGRIFNEYRIILEKLGVDAGQMLLTDEQLIDKKSAKTCLTKKILLEAFSDGVVEIINANDVIDNEEINALKDCADNDKLFKLVCLLVEADVAIIGLDQDGFLDLDGKVMHCIKVSEIESVLDCARGGNELGHGSEGMRTKVMVLAELAQAKIQAHLAPAKVKDFILRAVLQENDFGTKFCA